MITNKYLCEATIEYLEDFRKISDDYNQSHFEINNCEDIFKIVEVMKTKDNPINMDTRSITAGLKLFSDIMKTNQNNETNRYYLFKIYGEDKQFIFIGNQKEISFCH